MMTPKKQNLTILQGATFSWPFFWYSDVENSITITAITASYPTTIAAPGHGMADGKTPVALLGVPDWLKTASAAPADRIYATKLDTDTCTVPVNGIDQDAYTGTAGRLVFNSPMDLSVFDARMQIRASIDDDTVIEEFTVSDGHITLGTDGSVLLSLTDTITAALDFDTAVYDLELISNAGEVSRIATGNVTLSKEVTR